MPAKLTLENFIRRSNIIHKNKYDYSKTVYINNRTKVIIICPIHGEFLQTPNVHLDGYGCRKCSNQLLSSKTRYTKDQFVSNARKVHGNKYDYNKSVYQGFHINVIIICPEHGEFLQTPASHICNKQGCPKCVGLRRLTTEEFIEKSIKFHGNKYDYSKVDYKNNYTEVEIGCFQHGFFKQIPSDHMRRSGCPICQKSRGELLISLLLDRKNIKYIKQKTFADCINSETNCRLKYDFYLPEYNVLIEFNGIQHYEYKKYWHKNKENFLKQKSRDETKNNYAKLHGYKLVTIKWDDDVEESIRQILEDPISNN